MSKNVASVLNAEDGVGQPSPEECRALLQRVVSSRHIRRSARLRDFLEYVGTQALKTGASRIQEQEIGVIVFGREKNYDTSLDNIVRVNATELRKRLELYFAEEGQLEDVILDISRGGYTPSFRRRPTELVAPVLEVAAASEATTEPEGMPQASAEAAGAQAIKARKQVPLVTLLTGTALLLLLALAGGLAWQNRELRGRLQPWKMEDALQAFWAPFLGAGPETDVVLGDSSLALAEDLSGRSVSLKQYLDKASPSWIDLDPSLRSQMKLVLDRDDGSLGDFRVARNILELEPHSTRLHLKSARELTPENIRRNSVVLIGSRESNPWVELFKDELNFNVEYDSTAHHAFVLNRAPAEGESKIYDFPPDPGRVSGYCVIAFLPALSGTGSALILSGTDWRATRAAGEFVTSSREMEAFRRNLPGGEFQHFELLLKSSHLLGTPMNSTLVAYRIHQVVEPKH